MAQQHLKFGTYEAPDPDEDGYQEQYAVTSTSSTGRTMRGKMLNTVMFTVVAYNLKWTDISVDVANSILSQIMGKNSFDFYHYNVKSQKWETSKFYVSNITDPFRRLKEGEERLSELSFQVTSIDSV